MRCWRCNAEIPDYALFCTRCGCRVQKNAGKKKHWYEAEEDYDDDYDDYDDEDYEDYDDEDYDDETDDKDIERMYGRHIDESYDEYTGGAYMNSEEYHTYRMYGGYADRTDEYYTDYSSGGRSNIQFNQEIEPMLESINDRRLKDPIFSGSQNLSRVESTWDSASWAAWQEKKESWEAWKKQREAWNPKQKEEDFEKALRNSAQTMQDSAQAYEQKNSPQEESPDVFWKKPSVRIAAIGLFIVCVIILSVYYLS